MKFSTFFPKKRFDKKSVEKPTKLTPEEERELEGYQPDMQTEKIIYEKVSIAEEGGDIIESEEKEKDDIPVKGVLRTENLVKKYGKRTVANKVTIDVTQ